MIKLAKNEDLQEIINIYKKYIKDLGIYSKIEMIEKINNNSFYIYIINNKIVGFCSYQIMKRKPQIRIDYLCVEKEYRKKHIATKLIEKIKYDTKHLKLKYFVECLKGLENNGFYNKIGKLFEERKKEKYSILIFEI